MPDNDRPRIDPASIPDYVWDQGCSVLFACISSAMADPKLRQEYEDWHKEYLAEKAAT